MLRKLHKPMNDLQRQIVDARKELDLAYAGLKLNPMEKTHIEKVKLHTENLVMWNEMEEKSMRHRSKIDWLRMGDANNAFFHAYVKAINNTKSIQFLQKMMVPY